MQPEGAIGAGIRAERGAGPAERARIAPRAVDGPPKARVTRTVYTSASWCGPSRLAGLAGAAGTDGPWHGDRHLLICPDATSSKAINVVFDVRILASQASIMPSGWAVNNFDAQRRPGHGSALCDAGCIYFDAPALSDVKQCAVSGPAHIVVVALAREGNEF